MTLQTQGSTGTRIPPIQQVQVEPFRVTYSANGIEVSGRLTDAERAEHFIGTIEALKWLLPAAAKKSEGEDGAAN